MRIVPFMGFFYASFALVCPFVTDAFMARGQSYSEAQGNAGTAVMLSGFVFVEAVVELRGCGVTFAQVSGRIVWWASSVTRRLKRLQHFRTSCCTLRV